MATAHDVAALILGESRTSVDPLGLQKLVYFAQAWSLALNREPLYDDAIEAWSDGPVVDSLYQTYKDYGFLPILESRRGDPANLTLRQKAVVRATLDGYGHLSGDQLRDLTHETEPWRNARKGLGEDDRSRRHISRDSILAFFRRQSFGPPPHATRVDPEYPNPAVTAAALAGDNAAWFDLVEKVSGSRPESVS